MKIISENNCRNSWVKLTDNMTRQIRRTNSRHSEKACNIIKTQNINNLWKRQYSELYFNEQEKSMKKNTHPFHLKGFSISLVNCKNIKCTIPRKPATSPLPKCQGSLVFKDKVQDRYSKCIMWNSDILAIILLQLVLFESGWNNIYGLSVTVNFCCQNFKI